MKRHINAISAGEWSEASGRAAYEASLSAEETVKRLEKVAELASPAPVVSQSEGRTADTSLHAKSSRVG